MGVATPIFGEIPYCEKRGMGVFEVDQLLGESEASPADKQLAEEYPSPEHVHDAGRHPISCGGRVVLDLHLGQQEIFEGDLSVQMEERETTEKPVAAFANFVSLLTSGHPSRSESAR